MEWCFELSEGAVTIRQEGRCAVCHAIYRTEEPSLFKAWLRGEQGRVLLGTLIPEGGALRLHRSVEIAWLERQGVWPPTGADILAAYSLNAHRPPTGWSLQNEPWRLLDKELHSCVNNLPWGFLLRKEHSFFLAFPWKQDKAFPLIALFCLAKLRWLEGTPYLVFRFSQQGKPELPSEG